ncbi:MAG: hypothetical protein AB7E47_13945 [Desulfovibrionaceae bacterium]
MQQLQQLVDKPVPGKPSSEEFSARLQSAGVEVALNQASTGTISGISFQLDGKKMKGSALGKTTTERSSA